MEQGASGVPKGAGHLRGRNLAWMGVLASGQSDLTVGGDRMDPIYRVEFTEGH